MTDPAALLTMASAGTLAVGISAAAALKGWHGWLDLRRVQRAGGGSRPRSGRPDLTELRERVRRLEAIANGTNG